MFSLINTDIFWYLCSINFRIFRKQNLCNSCPLHKIMYYWHKTPYMLLNHLCISYNIEYRRRIMNILVQLRCWGEGNKVNINTFSTYMLFLPQLIQQRISAVGSIHRARKDCCPQSKTLLYRRCLWSLPCTGDLHTSSCSHTQLNGLLFLDTSVASHVLLLGHQ